MKERFTIDRSAIEFDQSRYLCLGAPKMFIKKMKIQCCVKLLYQCFKYYIFFVKCIKMQIGDSIKAI